MVGDFAKKYHLTHSCSDDFILRKISSFKRLKFKKKLRFGGLEAQYHEEVSNYIYQTKFNKAEIIYAKIFS